ncbi:MAG: hypothetical protein COC01_10200 [Bacteroidetes bacterium]|nr:hypothetical protein [Bacteroidia bacterium]PCH65185.1 MAG: hypothetical protein COC01_10200 [Bacteroidota bacterium]
MKKALISIIVIVLSVYLLKVPILKGLGNYLVVEDEIERADLIWLVDYNLEKIEALYKQGLGEKIIILGNASLMDLRALGIEYSSADTFKQALIQKGIPKDKIVLIREPKGIREYIDSIISYCDRNDLCKVLAPIEMYKTKNINDLARDKFEQHGINLMILPTNPISFKMDAWWEQEQGLIEIYSEYMKILYRSLNLDGI